MKSADMDIFANACASWETLAYPTFIGFRLTLVGNQFCEGIS
jgi:hypothetical protein